jgi:hypothetical protein
LGTLRYWKAAFWEALNRTAQFVSLHRTVAILGPPVLTPVLLWLVFRVRSVTDLPKIFTCIFMSYLVVFFAVFIWNLVRTPALIDADKTRKIQDLNADLDRTTREQTTIFESQKAMALALIREGTVIEKRIPAPNSIHEEIGPWRREILAWEQKAHGFLIGFSAAASARFMDDEGMGDTRYTAWPADEMRRLHELLRGRLDKLREIAANPELYLQETLGGKKR